MAHAPQARPSTSPAWLAPAARLNKQAADPTELIRARIEGATAAQLQPDMVEWPTARAL